MNEPLDFSDLIARTNLELKRLGWTTELGRQHLLQTYGKLSRQLLTDDELMEFLAYLQAQPTLPDNAREPIQQSPSIPPQTRDRTLTEESKSTSMDFSEIIVRTNAEIQRLGWTAELGRKHLLQTYGKRSRQLLSDDELLQFLAYLEAQPTPPDNAREPIQQSPSPSSNLSELATQTDAELKRLGWTEERESDYLMQNYGTRSRQLLTEEELRDFLADLQAKP